MTTDFGPFEIGTGTPPLVIAEIGVNHNGDRDLGLRQLRAAISSGARAVKFQSFKAAELAAITSPAAGYQRSVATTQREMLERLEMPIDHFVAYRDAASALGAVAFSSPFDAESLGELVDAGVEVIKVASGEITNLPLLMDIARTGLPTIMSTGMAELAEIEAAVSVHQRNGGGPLALLHCISSYPAKLEDMNLRALATLRERFDVPVGLSDHTVGPEAAMLAVALGAVIVEKHFTIDRALPGPDHGMSTEPSAFASLVRDVNRAWRALGTGVKAPVAAEAENRTLGRRSLVATRAVNRGTVLEPVHLASKRAGGGGLGPAELPLVLGRRTRRDLAADELITWDDLE